MLLDPLPHQCKIDCFKLKAKDPRAQQNSGSLAHLVPPLWLVENRIRAVLHSVMVGASPSSQDLCSSVQHLVVIRPAECWTGSLKTWSMKGAREHYKLQWPTPSWHHQKAEDMGLGPKSPSEETDTKISLKCLIQVHMDLTCLPLSSYKESTTKWLVGTGRKN